MSTAVELAPPLQPATSERPAAGATCQRRLPLVPALALYVPLAGVVTWLGRDQLNVDGVAYLRIARYYAEGNFDLAVTGYWAPLISWLLVPVCWLGGDLVLAGQVVNACAGALLIVATWWLGREFRLAPSVLWLVPTATALIVIACQAQGIFPDALLAALLTLYFAASWRMANTTRSRDALLCGALAGAGYLLKYYTLPFFVLHHALAGIFFIGRGKPHRARVALRCWLLGMLAFGVLAGPWLAVLSVRYGRPTFATTGRIVHSFAGPDVPAGGYWPLYRLMQPRKGRIATWENPDEFTIAWPQWSPTSGLPGALHQVRLVCRNIIEAVQRIFGLDGLGFLYVGMLAVPLLALMPSGNRLKVDPWPWRWILLSLACYLSGLMLVFAGTERYYWPVAGLLLLSLTLLLELVTRAYATATAHPRRGTLVALTVSGLVLASCALPALRTLAAVSERPGRELKDAAAQLRAAGVQGPLASNSWHRLVPVAYRTGQVALGVPLPGSPAEIAAQLHAVGARSFLLFDDDVWPRAALALGPAVDRAFGPPQVTVGTGGLRIHVYSVDDTARLSTRPGD